jgi:tetratricopeptide (TPR) repeat protein
MQHLRNAADELMALCEDEEFLLWFAVGYTYRGMVAEALGARDQAIAMMDEGLELFEQTGSRLTLVLMNVLCAEALHRLGEDDRALVKLQVAEEEMNRREEGLLAPDIWRVRGAILTSHGESATAEAAFDEAIRRARLQGALALELRCLLDLYELRSGQGRTDQVEARLTETLARFNQGLDRPEPARAAAIVAAVSN